MVEQETPSLDHKMSNMLKRLSLESKDYIKGSAVAQW